MNTQDAKRQAENTIEKATHSASADQAKGKTKQFIGKVKEQIGNAIGDNELAARGTAQRAEGKTDEIRGNVKEKIDDIADSIKGAAEAVKDKFDEARKH